MKNEKCQVSGGRGKGAAAPIQHQVSRVQHPVAAIQHPISSIQKPASGIQYRAAVSLTNTNGFWQLTFAGRHAVLKQHPALFYVAWLIAAKQSQPIAALELAAAVFSQFGNNPDLLFSAPWLCRQQRDADVAKVMKKRLHALEAILDRPDSDGIVTAEVEDEIAFIEQLQKTYFIELLPPGEKTCARITDDLLDLYATLASANDAQGNPHPVIRAFAFHLLVCVVMPSLRATRRQPGGRYVYHSTTVGDDVRSL
jgi:hypothetical protein